MARIPFKRVTEAFNEIARARLCESSGSEHSAGDSAELSDLVNSFIENDNDDGDSSYIDEETNLPDSEMTSRGSDSTDLLQLRNLLHCGVSEKNDVKAMILSETQLVMGATAGLSSNSFEVPGFKRQLMSQLRKRGLDAGLCKSRWKKIRQFPAGDYEYIDIMVKGTRYIMEVNLAAEFTIARPTTNFGTLLNVFPLIYIGEANDLKEVVKLMCNAIKKCMKNSEMQVPPWRKNRYMLAKWFGSYKKTVNAFSEKKGASFGDELGDKRWVGFETSNGGLHYCRGDQVGRRGHMGVGNLTQLLLNGSDKCN